MTEKWATQSGTEKYFHSIQIHPGKVKRFDDLAVSSLGAGTYLGASDDETDRLYEQLLLAAGLGGINFRQMKSGPRQAASRACRTGHSALALPAPL